MTSLLQILHLIYLGFTNRQTRPKTPTPPPAASPESPPAPTTDNRPPETESYGSATAIARALIRKGYTLFREKDGKSHNLNIVGVRNTRNPELDAYGCQIHIFWEENGEWKHLHWPATTYPGSRYLIERFLNPKGCAILMPDQYEGVYSLDIHNGKYRALCQRNGAVTVYRDGDRDREFDLDPTTTITGWYGINIHAPITPHDGVLNYIANRVYASSAGCQVFQGVSDFLEFRSLCEKAADTWGNQFTYTLLNDRDLDPADKPSIKQAHHSPPQQFDDLESWKPEASLHTTGIRNHNLLNVKGEGWRYSQGADTRGHHIFPSYAKGLRAGIITLRSYWTRHGLRSIAAILSRWAPVTDTVGSLPGAPPNSPKEYSQFVARHMGISPTEPLATFHDDGSVNDPGQLYALVHAMAKMENHASLELPREIFDEAVRLL